MNWKLLLIALSLIVINISARPADESSSSSSESTTLKVETTNLTEQSTIVTEPSTSVSTEVTTKKKSTEKTDATTTTSSTTQQIPTTIRSEKKIDDEKQSEEENRELKASSNLQLTSKNVNSEITLKESFHHGVAVPMTLEDYEKELAREKDLINKAKKKISMESSTPKEGISTWILLSGSNNPSTTSRPEKPAYRIDNSEKKNVVKNNLSNNGTATATTKKRQPTTQTPKVTKTTQKFNNNKLITRIKVSSSNDAKNNTDGEAVSTVATTKKAQITTKTKKYTTHKPKSTVTTTTTTTVAPSTTKKSTTLAPTKIIDDSMVIDDENDEPETIETSTYLIMEAKDDEFNLPNDRAPTKATISKKTSTTKSSAKNKKKKIGATTNSTRIKKKSDKIKTGVSKISASKKPEKPITTQVYNYLAREVLPTVGVGLVGLVVTAGLATYFLGGPLTALRRSYDIASRRDDVVYDRSDEYSNMQDEGEMFGKVIAGMPENSAYRNNIRINSYRVKSPQYAAGQYPAQQQYSHISKYGLQAQPQSQNQPQAQALTQQLTAQQQQQLQAQQQQQQYLRYRAADPYYNSYPKNQYVQQSPYYQQQPQQMQGKSNDYSGQSIQAAENTQNFNIDSVDMTTSEPSSSSYSMDYDEIAQSYFPQSDPSSLSQQQMTVEQQNMQEVESKPQPQYQPSSSSSQQKQQSEKVTIVNAQSVPSNHKDDDNDASELPTPEALKMPNMDDEYQNSIANAILNQSQKKQFVVGSVVAENFEDNSASGSAVPEHGPRRRRKREASKKPAAKSLENNEIDEDERVDGNKRQTENEIVTTSSLSTEKQHESSTHDLQSESSSTSENDENLTTTTSKYDLAEGQNNIFQLFRRIIELKLRMGLNFLQNATLAFQEYLKGVEERVQTSPLFNQNANSTEVASTSRKSNKIQRKKVESL